MNLVNLKSPTRLTLALAALMLLIVALAASTFVGAGRIEANVGALLKPGAATAGASADVQAALKEAESSAGSVRAAALGFGLAALLAAAGVGAWLGRGGKRPLADAARVADAVAGGDLTTAVEAGTGDPEAARLSAALQHMQTQLAAVVGKVRGNAEAVASASAAIVQGNGDLSQRTEQQASALEQTAASMEELGATVRQNADNARQANQLAMGASTVATRGGEVVTQVVETMKGINDSSKRIADIIGTIDGIAFQTNILALNAAVEAARAGEQGRGFAVVAGEVRSLAQRSAEAAKEIKGLINASVERVERGTALVDQAGATMSEIVTSIQRVSDIVGEISSASAEQSTGVAQIGEAVTQMDQTTQQNAAMVEKSAAAAESLSDQARKMVEALAVFKLKGGVAGAGSFAIAPAPTRAAAPAPVRKPAAAVPRPVNGAKRTAAPSTSATPSTPAAKPPPTAAAADKPPAASYPQVERRGPNRATNVVRPSFSDGAAKSSPPAAGSTGTDDWESF